MNNPPRRSSLWRAEHGAAAIEDLARKYKLTMDEAENCFAIAEVVAGRFSDAPIPAEDLRQVAYLGMLEGLRDYDPARGTKLSTYLFDRCRFAIWKATRRQPELPLSLDALTESGEAESWQEDWSEGVEEEALLGVQAERLRRAFSRLSEKQADTLRLLFFAGLSQAELARQRGCSINTVREIKCRALARLRAILAGDRFFGGS